jgi:hypothetical protein
MKFISLKQRDTDELTNLEEKMYWQGKKWSRLWKVEAEEKFRNFIKDYLTSFPQGCFGLSEDGKILGAMFLIKISELKPITYLHKFSEYAKPNGRIAYVSFFVVKKGKKQKEIARKLYKYAENVAKRLNCASMAVVIYSSPLEEEVLKENKYKKLEKKFEWEIYPGMKVPCWIYFRDLE